MSRYCLDTVAYSRFKRGEPQIAAILDSAEWVGIPAVVLGELFAGFEQGRNAAKNIAELDEFLASPAIEVLPVDRETAALFGRLIADLRRRGRPLPLNDIWIAAACIRAGATLLTWDAHFREMAMVGAWILG